MMPPSQQRGYVLLMTLVLIALVGIATVNLARQGMLRASLAIDAQADLQHRWGITSCQATLLPAARHILARAETERGMPQALHHLTVDLGQQHFILFVGDEQAKANVNELYRRRGKRQLEQSLRNLLPRGGSMPTLRLRPHEQTASAFQARQEPFGSFGQVFDAPRPQQLIGLSEESSTPSAAITCWGSGLLNYRRASGSALTEVCAPLLSAGEVDQLLWTRNNTPEMKLPQALARLQLSSEKRNELSRLLTESSSCHSLWIIARTSNHTRYHLGIHEVRSSEDEQTLVFAW